MASVLNLNPDLLAISLALMGTVPKRLLLP